MWISLIVAMYVPAAVLVDFLLNLGPGNQLNWSGLSSPFMVAMLSILLVAYIVPFGYIGAGHATVEATISQEEIAFRSHLKTVTYQWSSLLSIEPNYFLGQAAINVTPIAGTRRKRVVVPPVILHAILAHPACPRSLTDSPVPLERVRTGGMA